MAGFPKEKNHNRLWLRTNAPVRKLRYNRARPGVGTWTGSIGCGEMAEWLIALVLKTSRNLFLVGSNPTLPASSD